MTMRPAGSTDSGVPKRASPNLTPRGITYRLRSVAFAIATDGHVGGC